MCVGAVLNGAVTNGVVMNGAVMNRAVMYRVVMNGAVMYRAVMNGSVMYGAVMNYRGSALVTPVVLHAGYAGLTRRWRPVMVADGDWGR